MSLPMRLAIDVRDRTLESAPHFDPHLAVVLGDEEQHAVVYAFASELPRVRNADRVLLDLLRLRGRDQQYRDLGAFAALECGELLLQRCALPGVERAGEIGDSRLERRHRNLRRRNKLVARKNAAAASRTRGETHSLMAVYLPGREYSLGALPAGAGLEQQQERPVC